MALEKELAHYRKLRAQLESEAKGKWVLIRDDDYVGVYDSFEAAAAEAVRRFGRGPYLIREIGAPDMVMPCFCRLRIAACHQVVRIADIK